MPGVARGRGRECGLARLPYQPKQADSPREGFLGAGGSERSGLAIWAFDLGRRSKPRKK